MLTPPNRSRIRNRLLAALSPADFELLDPHLMSRSVGVLEPLVEPDAPIESVYFPETGLACFVSRTAAQLELGMVGREGFVGASVILDIDRVPFSASGQIAGSGFEISTEALLWATEKSRSLRSVLIRYTHALAMQAASTAYANARFTIEQRLARWLLMMQDRVGADVLDITHQFLAVMLCVYRPGVTVATQMLEGVGAIRAKRGRIMILDRQKLISIAQDSYGLAEAEYERVMEVQDRACDFDRWHGYRRLNSISATASV